jgi:Protein of unknown function (DUF4235)
MKSEKKTSRSATLLYRPVGLVSSIVGGIVAGQIFKQVWKHVSPSSKDDAPTALESEYPMREILIAAAVQGAIFAVVKASIDRGGARVFERWTGEWPGD